MTDFFDYFTEVIKWTTYDPTDIWGSKYLTAKFRNGELTFYLQNNDDRAYKCVNCGKSVLGDPRYHEVYEEGYLIGYKHRRKCI